MSMFKLSYTRQGKKRQLRNWYIDFVDHNGITHRVPAFRGKSESEELERKLHRLVDCKHLGERPDAKLTLWIESMPVAMRERLASFGLLDATHLAAGKTLAAHLDDFRAGVEANGASPEQAKLVERRVRRVMDAAGCVYWSDVEPNKIIRAISDFVAADGLSHQTFNFYLAATKQFAKWMVNERRISENPLGHLKGRNVKEDRRHDRRALTPDECRRLLSTTPGQPERWGMTGQIRALLYWLALETGLRAGELRSLTRAGFDLDANPPEVTVTAAYTKNGKPATIYLRPELVAALLSYLHGKLPTALVFNLPKKHETASMLKDDLEAAGVAYVDESGRYADFHALRHTFITNLVNSGVTPAVAQQLARHSSITLTMDRYTHVALESQRAALDRLPNLNVGSAEAERATGTDDKKLQSGMQERRTFARIQKTSGALETALDQGEPALAAASAGGNVVPLTGFEPVSGP